MNLLAELRRRLRPALISLGVDPAPYLDMVRRSQEAKFGDYQANFAMPLGKQLGQPPRDIAAKVVAQLDVADLCEPPEIAGPGFINLRFKDDVLAARLQAAVRDERLGVEKSSLPRTFVIDYSAPNVAKPMHVGHIRSTVIGDALKHILRFLGHTVIGDNHIGDWGTQFGMILYGYKHFLDGAAYEAKPVDELARQYRLVNRLVEYHDLKKKLPALEEAVAKQEIVVAQLAVQAAVKSADAKGREKARKQAIANLAEIHDALADARKKLAATDDDARLAALAAAHPQIGEAVLAETAKLHEGDAENLRLWHEFLPPCLETLDVVYRRLNVTFDRSLGESFYHDRLAAVVADLKQRGIAKESEGAVAVFFEGQATPLLIQKKDGAFLYATSDLATIQYRRETWRPDAMLYVVDHRQSLHFEQLFAAARLWGCADVELKHLSFGTVMGSDKRPYKTRSGDTVGLSGLLDEAVNRALAVVSENDESRPGGAILSADERRQIAETVGIGALKYADLSQNRSSDYEFSYDKMLAMNGNTATYMQYAYARVKSIIAKGDVDIAALRASDAGVLLESPAERALGLELLRFSEAFDQILAEYRPHLLTTYLFDLANRFSTFFEACPVLKAESKALRNSRLLLCDLTARTIRQGLALLGIEVAERM